MEKDLYVRGHFKTELETRLETRLKKIRLPLIFLNGQFLGVGIETKVLKITIYEMHFINNFYRNRQIIKSLFSLLSNVLQFIFLMIVLTLRYTGGGHNGHPQGIYALVPSRLI